MKGKEILVYLLAICSALMVLSACEIGESPMEIARKKSQPQNAPSPEQAAGPVAPVPSDMALPPEQAGPTELKPLPQEALEQVISWAVVAEEHGLLRIRPDENAKAVRELPFATVVLVLEKEASWYKAALIDKKTWGWISARDLHESPFRTDQFRLDDLANFYYAVSTTMERADKRARLLNLLIEQHAQSMISFRDPDTKMIIQGVARELALFSLADIYRANGAYQKAVEAYDTIITGSKKAEVKGYADWNILKIYKNDLRDAKMTIEQALQIIESYEALGLSGFEWNIWVDLSAAEVLLETLKASNASASDFVRYGDKVVAANNYPPVQIMGSVIRMEGHRRQNDLPAMERVVMEILKKHPTVQVQYYQRSVNYSAKALAFVLRHYLEGLHDHEAALSFARRILAGTSNRTLAGQAKFAIAYISDIGPFSREAVMAAYRDTGSVNDFLHDGKPVSPDKRLKAIQGFESFRGVVMSDDSPARLEPAVSSPVVFGLARGAIVTVLYGNPGNFQGKWLKVQTHDNRFGWVQADALQKMI